MKIDKLQLENFRNYRKLEISLNHGTNLFYGDNAQGKTNILEAVYVCGTTKSHRGSKDRELIHFDQDESHIRMNLLKNDISYRIDMHIRKNKTKGIAINGVPIHKASELLGIGNFVFFSPEDLNMIKDGPSERRRFLDMELCQLDKMYLFDLMNYNRILMQRNKLLKELSFHPEYEETLDLWDIQMEQYGTRLIRCRREFIRELNYIICEIHRKLSGNREELKVSYEANTSEDDFEKNLSLSREKDIKMKISHTGPHRDDLMFEINGIDIRKYGSQGQQRTAALSLKLAEIKLVKNQTKDDPVLLLDDVLSELDGNRQHDLLESISDIQALITGTGLDDFIRNDFRIDNLFYVEKGEVILQ